MKRLLFFILITSIFLTGCAFGPMPQNAKEYRDGMNKGGFGTSIESYVVNRSYSKVAKTLAAKTRECLHAEFTQTQCVNNSCTDYHITYKPTITKGKKHTELYVQWKRDPDNAWYVSGDPPPGGVYIAVIDAVPAGKAKTKITVYAPSMVYTTIPKAVKHWVNGTHSGCPTFESGF